MLLFQDSFDHYATADVLEKWTTTGVSGSGATTTIGAFGRRSSNGWRWVTGASGGPIGYIQKTLAPADATAVLGVAFTTSGAPAAGGFELLAVQETATSQVTVRLNNTMTLSVLRGAGNGTVLGTTTATLSAGVSVYLELKVLIANAGGTIDLRINGASVLALTGLDTQNTASATWSSLILGGAVSNGNAGSRNLDFDDLYVLDGSGAAPWNTFLGDCRVDVRLPTAAGATTGWTPSAGANYAAVDDAAPDDDATYTSTATVGATDTFVTQDAPVVGAAIFGVQHCLNLKKMDAGICTVAPVVRHGGVDYPGAALSPGTSYAYGLQIAQVNPGTSAQWTDTDFNAAEFGYKRTT